MRSLEQAYGTILRFLMAADVQEQQRFRDASTIDKKIAILKAFIDSSVGISRAEEQEDPSENWDDGPWNSDYSFNDGEQWTPRAE